MNDVRIVDEGTGGNVINFRLPQHQEITDEELAEIMALLTYFTRLKDDKQRDLIVQTAKMFMSNNQQYGDFKAKNAFRQSFERQLMELFDAVGGESFREELAKKLNK